MIDETLFKREKRNGAPKDDAAVQSQLSGLTIDKNDIELFISMI